MPEENKSVLLPNESFSEQEQRMVAHCILAPPLKRRRSAASLPEPQETFPMTSWSKYGEKNGKAGSNVSRL